MKRLFALIWILAVWFSASAQIARIEYFWDTDPGFGNGTTLSITPGDSVASVFGVNTTGLSYGLHTLYIRAQDDSARWSVFSKKVIQINEPVFSIAEAEYFIDTDPGFGNGTPITITPGDTIQIADAIPTNALLPGLHTLYVRVKDNNGKWSVFSKRMIHIQQPVYPIAEAEYFVDIDPGFGSGTPITITPGDSIELIPQINTDSLAPGLHTVYVRVKTTNNEWSVFSKRMLHIKYPDAPQIVAAEYFVDADPGFGNATAISLTAGGDSVTANFQVLTDSLSLGIHMLYVRVKDSNEQWSVFSKKLLYIDNPADDPVVAAEYFIDTDPGVGNATPITITPGDSVQMNFSASTDSLLIGPHWIHVRVQDAEGRWSVYSRDSFYVDNFNCLIYGNGEIEMLGDTCQGTQITFKDKTTSNSGVNSADFSYEWDFFNDSIIDFTDSIVNYTFSQTGTDTVVLKVYETNNPICQEIITKIFTIRQVDTTYSNVQICDGQTHFAGGANQTESGVYYDTYSNRYGCDSVHVTTLTVNENLTPAVTITGDDSICSGVYTVFTATPVNGGFPLYTWKINNVVVGSGYGTWYQFGTASLQDGDVVTVEITSSETCTSINPVTSNAITMHVTPSVSASVTIAVDTNNFCFGTQATVSVVNTTNAGSNPHYDWYINNFYLVQSGGTTLTRSDFGSGNYITCYLYSDATCVNNSPVASNNVTMNVTQTGYPDIAIQANTNSVCYGTPITFTASASFGGNNPIYEWFLNGNPVQMGSSNIYANDSLDDDDEIKCVLTSDYECRLADTDTSNTVTMDIIYNLPVSVNLVPSGNNICEGTGVTYSAFVTNGGASPVYNFFVNGNSVQNSLLYQYSYVPANSDSVWVVVTSDIQCATNNPAQSDTVHMQVIEYDTVSVSITATDDSICQGTEVIFTATPVNPGNNPNYLWRINNFQVQYGAADTFASASLGNGNVVTCEVYGDHQCTTPVPAVSNGITMNVTDTLHPKVLLSIPQTTICQGTEVEFTAALLNEGTNPVIEWLLNNNVVQTGDTTYSSDTLADFDAVRVRMTVNYDCPVENPVLSNPVVMTVIDSVTPSVFVYHGPNPACPGGLVSVFTTTTTGGDAPTYEFRVNGSLVQSGPNSQYSSSSFNDGDVVQVTMISNAECIRNTTALSNFDTIRINQFVPADVSIQATTLAPCIGELSVFEATPSNGGTNPLYSWRVNNAVFQSGASNIFNTTALQDGDSVYCIMTSSLSCATNNPAKSNTIHLSLPPCVSCDTVVCNDSSACTTDACVNGECFFLPVSCDDGNPCTIDRCDISTGCEHADIVCNDSSLCTTDFCSNGDCIFQPLNCNDGTACTDDFCDDATGECFHQQVICAQDADSCTIEICDAILGCISIAKDCSDGDACTQDVCQDNHCVNPPVVCTAADACHTASCDNGQCIQTPVQCDDLNPCTTNGCDIGTGCVFTPINCNDNNFCTSDSCDAGTCLNLPIPGCGNPCDTLDCDDGNVCTMDSCANGTCIYSLPQADLSITKTARTTVISGDTLSYTITVKNNGICDAQNVQMTDRLPFGSQLISFTPPAGWLVNFSTLPDSITATNPLLVPDSTHIFSLILRIPSSYRAGSIVNNIAKVSGDVLEANSGNNNALATTSVTSVADISIVKTADSTVVAGEELTYTITISNAGPSEAYDVTFADQLPPGTELVSISTPDYWSGFTIYYGDNPFGEIPEVYGTPLITQPSLPGWNISYPVLPESGNNLETAIPHLNLPPGITTITLVVHVDAGLATGDTLTNHCSLVGDTLEFTDPDTTNNTSEASTQIILVDLCAGLNCDDGNPCTTDSCDAGTCLYASIPGCENPCDTVVCDDGDFCTTNFCDNGNCVYTAIDCADGDFCTLDLCANGNCSHVYNLPAAVTETPEHDACQTYAGMQVYVNNIYIASESTLPEDFQLIQGDIVITYTDFIFNDADSANACDVTVNHILRAVTCDDGNPCTIDECSQTCFNFPVDCNDDNACTNDVCDAGNCLHTPIICSDSSLCTSDDCDAFTGCTFTPVVCDDGNLCTSDNCESATGCVYAAILCDDNSLCTTDDCNALTGCTFTPVVCDDANLCTVNDCAPLSGCIFPSVNCDDANLCTTDDCNSITGCFYTDVTCDDNDLCTTDTCFAQSGCAFAPLNCDDGDSCTIDKCELGICVNAPVICFDGDFCTRDTCISGTCFFLPITCADNNACTDDACDIFSGCQFTARDCNDGNACTNDLCDVAAGCYYTQVICDDNDACTSEYCELIFGCTYTPVICDDSSLCTIDACDALTGCSFTPINCDDGEHCTFDFCDNGNCLHVCDENSSHELIWEKAFGGNSADGARSIHQTNDGGYIVTGYAFSNNGDVTGNHGQSDFWAVRLDASGNLLWQKALGGGKSESAASVRQTSDGGYVLAGNTKSNNANVSGNHGGEDFWVVKLDAAGNLIWQKTLGGSNADIASSVDQTTDGGYIVAGYTSSNNGDVSGNHGGSDYWVVKLDASGNLQWQKALGGTSSDQAQAIQQTSDGGYIVAGNTKSNNGDVSGFHGASDSWVVKLDGAGNISWQKTLGGSAPEAAYSVKQTSDGGYVVAGSSQSSDDDVSDNKGGNDYWVVKLDGAGNLMWEKNFGGSSDDVAQSVATTTDNGFIVAGASKSNDGDVSLNKGNEDFWAIRLDANGNLEWEKSLGGNKKDHAYSTQQTADEGFIIAGFTDSHNNGDIRHHNSSSDFWVVKLGADRTCRPLTELAQAICAGDSVFFGNNYVKESGVYSDSLINRFGCDSIVTLTLTVAQCEDGDPCTVDICANGICSYVPLMCDDNNACTIDDCDAQHAGCFYTAIICNDNNPCTTDECHFGACLYQPVICDDNNACTEDACVNGTCEFLVERRVLSFTLVDAATEADLRILNDGDTINLAVTPLVNIRADVCATSNIESMKFLLNGSFYKMENIPFYTIAGDNGGNYNPWNITPGVYTIRAIPYSGNNGTGITGIPLEITIVIIDGLPQPCTPNDIRVSSFTLVNAATDTDIGPLVDGAVINLALTGPINVRANIFCAEQTAMVRFKLNGTTYRNEGSAPYSLAGDNPAGNYHAWNVQPGVYTILATPYSGPNATGITGTPLSITITVIGSAAKMDSQEQIPSLQEMESVIQMSAYPNPFSDKLNIEFTLAKDSGVQLEIFNLAGQRIAELFEGDVKAGELQKHEFAPDKQADGMFIYHLQTASGSYYGKAVMVR